MNGKSAPNHLSSPFDLFLPFLRNRANLIEILELASTNTQTTGRLGPKVKSMIVAKPPDCYSSDSTGKVCPKCNDHHYILSKRPRFLALSTDERIKLLPTHEISFQLFSFRSLC